MSDAAIVVDFVVFQPNGTIVRAGQCIPELLSAQSFSPDEQVLQGAGTPFTHYVTEALEIAPYTEAALTALKAFPGPGRTWAPRLGQWVDGRLLEEVRADVLNRLKLKRESLLESGFTWNGSTFDSDSAISQPRLLGAFTTVLAGGWPAEGVAWRLKDNTWRVLSAVDVQNVWAAFQFRMTALFNAFEVHETAIKAEMNAAALRSYNIEVGWP